MVLEDELCRRQQLGVDQPGPLRPDSQSGSTTTMGDETIFSDDDDDDHVMLPILPCEIWSLVLYSASATTLAHAMPSCKQLQIEIVQVITKKLEGHADDVPRKLSRGCRPP